MSLYVVLKRHMPDVSENGRAARWKVYRLLCGCSYR